MRVKLKLAALLGIATLAAMGLATGSAVAAEGKNPIFFHRVRRHRLW